MFFICECSRFGYLSQFNSCLNFGYIKRNKTFSVIIYTKEKERKVPTPKNCVLRVLSFAVHSPKSSVLRVLTFVSIIFRGSYTTKNRVLWVLNFCKTYLNMLPLLELKLYLEVKCDEKLPKYENLYKLFLKKIHFFHIFKMCFTFLTEDDSVFAFLDSHKWAFP